MLRGDLFFIITDNPWAVTLFYSNEQKFQTCFSKLKAEKNQVAETKETTLIS